MAQKEFSLFVLLAAAFVAALVIANVLASKIVAVGGIFVPAGVLAYSITFAVTDTVCEIWGRQRTQALVRAGFVALVLAWGLAALAVRLPPAPFWPNQQAYATVLGAVGRITIASLLAYAVSQTFDVWVFHRIGRLTASRWLWLRNNASTLASQTLDTTIFVTVAFYGVLPIWPLIVGQLIAKYLIAVADTPVVYALVFFIRPRVGGKPAADGE
ncbi:MAG: queuosine precursor transporter [bacterium]